MHVCLHSYGRDRERSHLLGPGTHLGSHWLDARGSKRRYWLYVLVFRLGLSSLAALGLAIRQTAGLPVQHRRDNGDTGLGTVHNQQQPMDREQSLARLFGGADREFM